MQNSWRGTGDRRSGRAGRHSEGRGGKKDRPCRNLQQRGRCQFGARCDFYHDSRLVSSAIAKPKRPQEGLDETPEQMLAKEDYNSWKRLIKTPPRANDTKTIDLLWSGALQILNSENRDRKQMLPQDLDDQEHLGREHIRTLLSMLPGTSGHNVFVDLARPFILVMTHPALLDCLSVDTFVGSLYNYTSGSHGSRAIPFLHRLSASLLETHLELARPSPITTAMLEMTLAAMSTFLRELMEREQRAAFHDDLPDLINSMENTAEVVSVDPNTAPFHTLRNNIGELRGVLTRANGLLQHEEQTSTRGVSTSVVTSTYPREIILPRDRHDNDKADITMMEILPTEDEIRSDHPEFLPSTDLNQPHFLTDPVGRHLDTQFRLYRHECSGQMSEALGAALLEVENDSKVLEDPNFGLGDVRAYTSPKARIRYISFDQRRGLEAQVSFPQPANLRKQSAPDRRRWWEESGRLEEGVVLCFLSINDDRISLIFFVVSEKCVDVKKDVSLSSDKHHATITVKLATRIERDIGLLIRLSCQKLCGLLVEFRDVKLGTFVPILENIKNMQRSRRLQFRQWILPDRIAKGQAFRPLDIPPPLYARRSSFAFSLKPILNNPESGTSIDLRSSIDSIAVLDRLEAETQLDRGQCQGLVAALTREFAFIKGPPGTGKSYLGLQIMRVLQASKLEAPLGPVVVV